MATNKGKVMMLIEAIEATTATQIRAQLNKDIIKQYEEDLEHGAVFPAVIVFAEKGSSRHILADGFHRIVAHVNVGREEIEVEVHEGGMHEALAYALQANRTHGLRRTNADKINAVKMALKDPVFGEMSQQEVADLCGVSRATVNRTSVRDTTGREDEGVTKLQEPAGPTESDKRPTKEPPTQAEVELAEVRQAMSLIKALPYGGDDAANTLEFSKDDIADLEYTSTWCSHAVLESRTEKANVG